MTRADAAVWRSLFPKDAAQIADGAARAHDKVLRVARTVADLDAAQVISCSHVSEAINYRLLDRSLRH